MIKTVDNFQGEACTEKNKTEIKKIKNIDYSCYIEPKTKQIDINLSVFLKNENKIFSFFETKEPKNKELEIIISVKKDSEDKYIAQTGNYIGKFKYNNIDIEINSRFGEAFLKRMLNFANDVYLDDVDVIGDTSKDSFDISKFILFYLFIQKLEKAFLLGLPKAYTTINHHNINIRGNIDINRFIKHDIPFRGKISSKSREQIESQEITDVLYKTISIIEKSKFSTKNIAHIKTHLKQQKSKNYVSNQTIQKAINHKALNNPIFAPYKEILKIAQYIINQDNLEEKESGKLQTYGFLIDVASLFELYLVKLLRHNFDDWEIVHEEPLKVYDGLLYKRNMYPDIVMKKDNKVIVLDAKYKRMNFQNGIGDGKYGDLDRNDFFQINTYMTYYDKQESLEVIAGGLLYPIEKKFDESKAHSDNWFGDSNTKFIVDGIDLSYDEGADKKSEEENNKIRIKNILRAEENFIERIKNLINQT